MNTGNQQFIEDCGVESEWEVSDWSQVLKPWKPHWKIPRAYVDGSKFIYWDEQKGEIGFFPRGDAPCES